VFQRFSKRRGNRERAPRGWGGLRDAEIVATATLHQLTILLKPSWIQPKKSREKARKS
jgi:hypothetical protein